MIAEITGIGTSAVRILNTVARVGLLIDCSNETTRK